LSGSLPTLSSKYTSECPTSVGIFSDRSSPTGAWESWCLADSRCFAPIARGCAWTAATSSCRPLRDGDAWTCTIMTTANDSSSATERTPLVRGLSVEEQEQQAHDLIYDRFTPKRKRTIVAMCAWGSVVPCAYSIVSPTGARLTLSEVLVSGSFVPAIPQIADDLNSTPSKAAYVMVSVLVRFLSDYLQSISHTIHSRERHRQPLVGDILRLLFVHPEWTSTGTDAICRRSTAHLPLLSSNPLHCFAWCGFGTLRPLPSRMAPPPGFRVQ
jgi:hypothetical protein